MNWDKGDKIATIIENVVYIKERKASIKEKRIETWCILENGVPGNDKLGMN